MADQHQRHVVFIDQHVQQIEDPGLHHHIQRRCRFIGNQQLRPKRTGHCYDHPLALSAG